jgi:hypothetical protein
VESTVIQTMDYGVDHPGPQEERPAWAELAGSQPAQSCRRLSQTQVDSKPGFGWRISLDHGKCIPFLGGTIVGCIGLGIVCSEYVTWKLEDSRGSQDMPREFPVDHHAKQAVVVYSL